MLFLFHKEFGICRANLKRLRKLNSDIKVYALYGGPISESDNARIAIQDIVDDFYVFEPNRDPIWKWKHLDQMTAIWFKEKGQYLEWETLLVMHWDMLILAPLCELFAGLKPGEILLSGLRPLNTVSSWWPWVQPDNQDLESFKKLLNDKFSYKDKLLACLFIVVCYPRQFLEKYIEIGHPDIGFLEYKIPTLAHIFGIPFCHNHTFQPWWAANPVTKKAPMRERILNAVSQEVPRSVIMKELASRDGLKLFHPVFRNYPKVMEYRYIAFLLCIMYPIYHFCAKRINSLLTKL